MKFKIPLNTKEIESLRIGDLIYLSGIIFTIRDASHKKLIDCLTTKKVLPFDMKNSIIYYTGPTPTPPNKIIGSIGPTSSYRMDPYSIILMQYGSKITIGKGPRSNAFKKDLEKHKGIYLSAIGGTGALLSKCVESYEVIAFPELLSEAIHKLKVKDFPAIVIYDSLGNDFFTKQEKNKKI